MLIKNRGINKEIKIKKNQPKSKRNDQDLKNNKVNTMNIFEKLDDLISSDGNDKVNPQLK